MNIKIIQTEHLESLKSLKGKIIIFGAGDLGTKIILPVLLQNNINVFAFWDNNPIKQGTFVNGIKILSYEEISALGDINIIVGSNYIKQEENRINRLSCDNIIQIYIPEPLLNESEEDIKKYIVEIEKNKQLFKDKLSIKSIDCLLEYLDKRDVSIFQQVAIPNQHYLINEVVKALKPDDVMVDLGAFIGEFPIDLMKSDIPYKKCYCFEISDSNCEILNTNMKKYNLNNVECVPLAAYDKCGEFRMTNSSANSAITESSGDFTVRTVTLDSYFKDKPFNYIKSDIEGAEMPALIGGQNVIKKNRPILAISIYHSLSDYLNIPKFLNNLLDNYTFMIRNHSVFCAEIVLYAIPNERI